MSSNKTDEQNEWLSRNEICKSTYSNEDACNAEGTGCKWKEAGSYVDENNKTVNYEEHCSNWDKYPK